MASTTAPVAISARFRAFIVPGLQWPASRTGRPGLVVATRAAPGPADIVVPGRAIGMGGTGQVRPVFQLPRIELGLGQRRWRRVVQPGMPLRRHGCRLLAPGEQNPAAGPVIDRLAGAAIEIDIAETVGANLAPGRGRGAAKPK